MKWLDRQRIRYTLSHHPIPREAWETLMREVEIFNGLNAVERAHLRELTILFLHRKTLSGVQGLNLSPEMALSVAAQACLLILKLGLGYYASWVEVVIYPAAFRVTRDSTDAMGLVSHEQQALGGESWLRGPVILSWDGVVSGLSASRPGHNVVMHEFAHKLDMLNGSANGLPPLHSDMVRERWTAVFVDAFEHLLQQLAHDHHPAIDPYGATDPAEFFAVASEYFFTAPRLLHHYYPAVYDQLTLFYRQDPATRRAETSTENQSKERRSL